MRATYSILARDDVRTYQGNLVELNNLIEGHGYYLQVGSVWSAYLQPQEAPRWPIVMPPPTNMDNWNGPFLAA